MSSYMSFELFMNRWFFCEWPDIEVQRTRGDAGSQTHCGVITWHGEETSSDLACSYAKSEFLQQSFKLHLSGYFFPFVAYSVSEVKMPWGPWQWECQKSNTYYRQVFLVCFSFVFCRARDKLAAWKLNWGQRRNQWGHSMQLYLWLYEKHRQKNSQKNSLLCRLTHIWYWLWDCNPCHFGRGERSYRSLHHPCFVITKPGT